MDDALFGKSAIIPANLFERLHGCSFIEWLWPPNIPNCIKATILNPVHDAYEDFRRNLQNDLDQRIIAEFQQSQTVANILANVVYLNVDRQLQKTSEGLDRNIDRAFFLRDVVSLFSLIAAILVSLKILLYILVRLVFDDGTAKKGCALSNPVPVHSKIKATRISPGESGSNSQVSETKFVDTYVRVAGSMISNCVSCMTTHARPSARGNVAD